MVSTFDILDVFKPINDTLTHADIRAILNMYIRLKYVRYYRNERGYIYFGITELGYAKYGLHIARQAKQMLSEVAVDSVKPDELTLSEGVITQSDVIAPPAKRKRTRKAKTTA
jgi:hypothetical protein